MIFHCFSTRYFYAPSSVGIHHSMLVFFAIPRAAAVVPVPVPVLVLVVFSVVPLLCVFVVAFPLASLA